MGVEVLFQAHVQLKDVVVERVYGWGYQVDLPSGGRGEMTDCVASEIGVPAGRLGVGIALAGRGQVELRRVLVDAALHQGINLDGGANARLEDVVVRHLPLIGQALGVKIDVANVSADRLIVDNVFGAGLIISGRRDDVAALLLRDVIVRGAVTDSGRYGRGIQLSDGAETTMERVTITHMAQVGLIVGLSENSNRAAGQVNVSDLVVRGTDSFDLTGGHGVSADSGAQLTLTRAQIVGNRSMGLTGRGWGSTPETRLILTDVVVADTRPERCADHSRDEGGCRDDRGHTGGGSGLTAIDGARVSVDRFRVSGNLLTGVYIDEGSVVRADHGDIVGNAVGVYSGPGTEVLGEWFGDVRLFDNDTDLARELLPLPRPAEILEF